MHSFSSNGTLLAVASMHSASRLQTSLHAVLRGSDGLLGSNDAPGGVLNFQRKRPLDHNQLVIDAGVGSWDRLYGALDASGPLGFDGHLRGRAVVSISVACTSAGSREGGSGCS